MSNRVYCFVQIVFSIVLLFSFFSIGQAATLTVDNSADSNDGVWGNGTDTLREAIAHASTGDTINFSLSLPATITLASTLTINKNLTISGPTTGTLSVSGNNAVRVFEIAAGTVTISNLTVSNGYLPTQGDKGAGFYVETGATLYVNYCDVHSNGLFAVSGSTSMGAGFFVAQQAALHIDRSEIYNNTISGDVVGSWGAGIYVLGGTLTATNSTIYNNTSGECAALGGKNYVAGVANITLENCTISGNNSTRADGVVCLTSGNMSMTNCTVTNNVSAEYEAGIWAGGSTSGVAALTLRNTIVAGNLPANGLGDSDIFFDIEGLYGNAPTFTSYGYNLIGSTGVQAYTWTTGDVVGTEAAKQNAGLAALADNGGPTMTHALLSTSQAINPASSNSAPGLDQRGASRSGTADKGAYEYNGIIADSTPPTITSIVRKTPAFAVTNADTVVFLITFSEDVQNLDTSDFDLSGSASGDGTVSNVTVGSASVYDVTISGIAGSNGTINLDIEANHNIQDSGANALTNTTPTGVDESYTIDNVVPEISSIVRQTPASAVTNADTVVFRITFSEEVQNIDASDFVLSGTAYADGTVSSVTSVTGTAYDVTVTGLASSNGTVNLDVAAGQNIGDQASNVLTSTTSTGADETYTLDNTAPSSPSTPDMTAGTDLGRLNTDNLTSDNTPTFTGTAEANSMVSLISSVNNTVGTATADGTGNWTITASVLTPGVHNITATATDATGNTSADSTALAVTVDTTAPSAPGTPDMTAGTDSGASNSDNKTSDTAPTFTGTAEANSTVSLISSVEGVAGAATADGLGDWSINASILSEGAHNMTVKATDAAGNVSGTSSALAITVDTSVPVFSGTPANISTDSDPGKDTAAVNWTAPTANDMVDGSVTPQQTEGHASGSDFPMGPTTITYTATDQAGNSANTSFTVSVNDNEDPVISGMQANIATTTDPGQGTAVVNWTAPTVSDNVDGSLTPTITSSPTAGLASGSAFPVGTTTVTCSATDTAGNNASADFSVTVVDNQESVFSGMPADMTVSTPSSSQKTVAASWSEPTASDNVDGSVTPVQTDGPASGSEFPVGDTIIAYSATDSAGNVSTASFTITVIQTRFNWWLIMPGLVSTNRISGGVQ